ncbi:MAG: EAL domain-containing protein [Acidobacteriota bacterium]
MKDQRITGRFMMAVIAMGALALTVALVRLPVSRVDVPLLLLSAFTIILGSRITIQIPRFKSHIAVSDTFIFLTLLLYGGEFAIVLAALEAFCSSWRFCNKKLTVFFNAATMAVSTSAVVLILEASGLYSDGVLHGRIGNQTNLVIALSLIALLQFGFNTSIATVYDALKNSLPLWETWKTKYIWTFFSYFIGSTSAGILIQLVDTIGIGVVFATFPVILFVYLTYRMYMKNVEISIQQAEQAEQYARIMEAQSEALRESEERFRSAFNYAPIGIALVNSTGQWLKVNRALCEILGYTEAEFLGVDFQSMIFSDDLGPTLVSLHDLYAGTIPSSQMEQRYVHKSGRTVWASWSASITNDARTENPRLIFQIQDITDKKSAEKKLQHEATHDVLTGLPNRSLFMARLTAALDKSRRIPGYRASVLFIDLDRFKYVNDSLGHLVGDLLLKEISVRLVDCMRPSDLVARLGGDEFTILVEGTFDPDEVTRIAERIQNKFGRPFELNGNEVYSSASIGILHASNNHLAAEDMMRDADTAMYQAKRAGKARHEVFNEEMLNAAREILRLETDLRKAIERDEIDIYYQPIVDLETQRIVGLESLARWTHAEMGSIPPNKFIPIAEEIGMIDKLSERVLRRACRDIGSLRGTIASGELPTLSVNLSCRQFAQTTLVRNIERILEETQFSPHHLKFEITESVFVEHQARAVEMLKQLRDSGVDIHIDDFGTGYSNLSYLMKLPISTLKIDRSFVAMINRDGGNDEIVRAIVSLARTLGLKVIAEGIETQGQLGKLKELGCNGGQGYLFAPPMNFADLEGYLHANDYLVLPARRFADLSTLSTVQ